MFARRAVAVVLAGGVVFGGAAGCASSSPVTSPTSEANADTPQYAASDFIASTTAGEVNEVYLETPRELAGVSELVLSGHVVSVGRGPSYSPKSVPQDVFSSVYIEVVPDSVVAGEYPVAENVLIAVNYVGPEEHIAYERFVSPGTPVVAYLHEVDLSHGLVGGEDSSWVLTPGSDPEVPGNGRLWIAASSQGLIFDLGGDSDNLAWPLLGATGSGALADTLPTGSLIGLPE